MQAVINGITPVVNIVATRRFYPAGGDRETDIVPRHFAFMDEDGVIHHAIAMGLTADNKERTFDEQIIWALRDSGRIDDGLRRQLTGGVRDAGWQALYSGSL